MSNYLVVRMDPGRTRLYSIFLCDNDFPSRSLLFCHDKLLDDTATWEWHNHFSIVHEFLESRDSSVIIFDSQCKYETPPCWYPSGQGFSVINISVDMYPEWPGARPTENSAATRQREE